MTPEQEASYALAFGVARTDLPRDAQLAYDRLVELMPQADRERVIGTLKTAFVAGMLDRDEFDQRLGQALVSRTCPELAALTADLPAGLTAAMPPEPARKWPGKKEIKETACGAAAGVVLMAAMLTGLATHPDRGHPGMGPFWPLLITVLTLFSLPLAVTLLLAGLGKLAGRRSARGLPPGAGGEASQRLAPTDPAGQLPQIDHDPRHTAQAAPIRRTRAPLPGWWPPHRGRCLGRRYAIGYPGR